METNFPFLTVLKKSGEIEKKIFSIEEVEDTYGKFSIGSYPSRFSRTGNNYTFCNVTSTDDLDDDYRDSWVCELSLLIIDEDTNFTDAIEISGRVIFDYGYDYISGPLTF